MRAVQKNTLDNSFTKSQSKTPRRVKNSLLLAELASFLPIFEPSGNGEKYTELRPSIHHLPRVYTVPNPEWLEYSLFESRHKLGVDCIDVVLLTQPELFLLDARDRNARYRDILDQEIETLLIKAFTQLEEEYRKGHIQYYGVVSATLGHPGDSIEHLSPALILRAAQKAGGKSHRCRVLQGPLNFLETGLLDWQNASTKEEDPISVAEYLSQENMTLLTHRPLNASQGSKNFIASNRSLPRVLQKTSKRHLETSKKLKRHYATRLIFQFDSARRKYHSRTYFIL